MNERCEDCYFHLAEDCPGEGSVDLETKWIAGLDCWRSIEDVDESVLEM